MAVFLRKYNVTLSGATLIGIPIVKRGVVDFAVGADWTPSAGDVKVSKDGGAAANIGTLPSAVAMGNGAYWEFTLTGTELSAKRVVVTVADSATKAVEDQSFVVETFGDASAMYQADFSAANLPANVTQFGGTAGTFSGGRPEVNTTQIEGTDATNQIRDTTGPAVWGYDFATAGAFADSVGEWLYDLSQGDTSVRAVDNSGNPIASADKLKKYIQLALRKDAAIATDNAAEVTELNADGGSGAGAYANTTDSLEANRDNIGTAGAGLTAADDAVITILNARIVGTLMAGEHVAQSGDSYPIVSHAEHGNAALKTLIDALNDLDAAGVRAAVGLASANLDTQLGTLATPAQVNAEVLDVLNVDTFAQPGQGTPAATTTIRLMLAYLYKAWRNKTTQSPTQYSLYNDDASTVDQKATAADDGTFTRGEVATGP